MRHPYYERLAPYALSLFTLLLAACTPPKSELQQEAERRTQKWWDATVAKCGEDYYTRIRWSDMVMGSFVSEDELYQLKNAMYYVKWDGNVSEADKLNGVEGRGMIVIRATAYRKRYTDNSGWSSWSDGVPKTQSDFAPVVGGNVSLLDESFSKEKGQWSIGEDGKDMKRPAARIKPSCSEIPPG